MEDNKYRIVLIGLIIFVGLILYRGVSTNKAIKEMQSQIAELQAKVDSLEEASGNYKTVKRSKKETTKKETQKKSSKKDSKGTVENTDSQVEEISEAISCYPEYELVDRLLESEISLPDVEASEEGVIVVNITVSWDGEVTKSTVSKSMSTLSDRSLQTACREAAQNTAFDIRPQLKGKAKATGTITYTFSR